MNGGTWDSVLGGGFWWNTEKPFKPTNTNALAALFFSRLYNFTKNETYLQWSSKTLSWLESTLYTPSNGLFAWYISLNTTTSTLGGEEAKEGIGGHVNTTYFAYDNAIMTLVYQQHQQQFGGTSHSSTATDTWSLVSAILKQFWISSSGVFQESTVSGSVDTMLSGWVTDSFLSLVLTSPSLSSSGVSQLAEVSLSNLNFINEYLRNETIGSAYMDCYSNGEGRRFGNDTFYLLDSAWLQRLNSRAWTYNTTTTMTTTTTTTTFPAPE
jgi:hypothetical protein